MKKKIAIINWTDSALHGTNNYRADDEELKSMEGLSCGIIVREDKKSITLAIDDWNNGEYRNCETICKKQINKIIRKILTEIKV